MRCDESATRGTARCHGICSLINNLTLFVLITEAEGYEISTQCGARCQVKRHMHLAYTSVTGTRPACLNYQIKLRAAD